MSDLLRPYYRVTFRQRPTSGFPNRNAVIVMPFITEFTCVESWRNLTATATLKFPKKIILQTTTGRQFDLTGNSISLIKGGTDAAPPFFLRGDEVTVDATVWYFNEQGIEQKPPFREIYSGFIAKVQPHAPVEISLEDRMFKCKQIKAQNKLYKASQYDAEGIVKDLILQYNSANPSDPIEYAEPPQPTSTKVGDFRVQNNTIAQVLEYMQKTLHINSWFRGNKLHSGAIVYYPNNIQANHPVFHFQKNIIPGDNLNYTRTDDLAIGVHAYSVQKEATSEVNSKGKTKVKHKRIELYVGDVSGEIRTYYSPSATSTAELKKEAEDWMRRWRYEGFQGKFTTFGEPYVNHGDLIDLANDILPDQNGTYFVKSVERSAGVGGYRQTIELDLRTDGVFTDQQIKSGI